MNLKNRFLIDRIQPNNCGIHVPYRYNPHWNLKEIYNQQQYRFHSVQENKNQLLNRW